LRNSFRHSERGKELLYEKNHYRLFRKRGSRVGWVKIGCSARDRRLGEEDSAPRKRHIFAGVCTHAEEVVCSRKGKLVLGRDQGNQCPVGGERKKEHYNVLGLGSLQWGKRTCASRFYQSRGGRKNAAGFEKKGKKKERYVVSSPLEGGERTAYTSLKGCGDKRMRQGEKSFAFAKKPGGKKREGYNPKTRKHEGNSLN